jgi:hypothetical protein
METEKLARLALVSGVLVVVALGTTVRLAPAQNTGEPSSTPTSRIRRLLSVSDPIIARDRAFGLGFFRQEGAAVSKIHGISDDGSVYMSDYAGVSLLRFPNGGAPTVAAARQSSGAPEILLDSSRGDPVDGIALARILQVVTNRRG